jgi:predicted TIM-barrel fold metal-dependent hydrolase
MHGRLRVQQRSGQLSQASRRSVVQCLGLVAAAATFPAAFSRAADNALQPFSLEIDAHCHIFNGVDIPVFGFFEKVILEDSDLGELGSWFGAPIALLLASVIEGKAHSYADEKKVLEQAIGNPQALSGIRRNSDDRENLIDRGLQNYLNKFTSFGRGAPLPRADRSWNDAFIVYLVRRLVDPNLTEPQIRERLKKEGPDFLFKKMDADQKKAAGLDKALQVFYQYLFVWAPMYTDYRFQILDSLKGLFGDPGDRLRVLTPAALDFDNWLRNDFDHPTPPAQQADLMSLISLAQDPTKFAVHGLIGFDPWRYLSHPKTGLTVVKKAIAEQGFVGVKIYPPMGFRALGNDQISDREFPPGLQKYGPHIGAKLDDALRALYDCCESFDVPIMAHCAPTMGAGSSSALNADAKYWDAVFSNFHKLRVNLGHFGGIWNFDCAGCANSGGPDWTAEIGGLMKKYPNRVYADVADFSGVLDRWDEAPKTKKIFQNLADMAEHVPGFSKQILYGSDFSLLGREWQYEKYYGQMRSKYKEYLGTSDIEGFLGENAKTFFGLHQGQPTRMRLEKFYGKRPKPDFGS